MALPIVMTGDIINVQIRGRLYNQVTITSLFYQYATGSGSDIAQVAAGFSTGWWSAGPTVKAAYLNCCAADYNFDQLWVQIVYPNRYASVLADGTGAVGTLASPALPSNSCAVLSRKTGNATKRKLKLSNGQLGNLHIPGVPTTSVVGDRITDLIYLNNLGVLASALVTTATLGTAGTALAGLFHARQPVPGFDQLNIWSIDNDVRTMRRRTLGRGI